MWQARWQLLLIVALSAGYEYVFLGRSNGELFDEGWPLYAAMRLHAGGVLYRDVFFVFPPGHLLPAWLAYWLDPPGVVLARGFYAGFNVVLCVALYLLGRRIMPARFALFSALLVAVAAPHSHMGQLLFGYRFLIFSTLALLAFARWLENRWPGWLLIAGGWSGIALLFRSSPAFAVSCGIGLAIFASQAGGGWLPKRETWVAGGWFAAGLLLVVSPALLWFANSVGLDVLWRENVVRLMGLQLLQRLPVPSLELPDFTDRKQLHYWFVALQYWAYAALFTSYTLALGAAWWRGTSGKRANQEDPADETAQADQTNQTNPANRTSRQGRSFAQPLLLAIAIWGGVFLLRTLGRSDDHHLNSALPPVCLLLGHLAALAWQRFGEMPSDSVRPSRSIALANGVQIASLLIAFGLWLFVQGHDRHFAPLERGWIPIEAGSDSPEGGRRVAAEEAELKQLLRTIEQTTQPNDTILDLTASPLLHPLSGRHAVGEFDIFMPGTFINRGEEERFIARLEADPPELVIWPGWPFDTNPERAVQRTAPRVSQWVKAHYQPRDSRRGNRRFIILLPR